MTACIPVELGSRDYPVRIGTGLIDRHDQWRDVATGRRVLVVSDETVARHYGDRVVAALACADRVDLAVVKPGERSKTLDGCNELFRHLAALSAGRDALIVALGGGVIGDLAGFAAACWMRGIAFVQVPTTLLAMVDSSVGGKTGVNLPVGKNLIGAFHQPVAVIADVDTLATLPRRELSAGLAEVVKYGALGDAGFFDWLEANVPGLAAVDPVPTAAAIATCVRQKAGIVARDERENGERALLNFGHTFGHAIETATDYDRYLHGEAVAIGMVLAARLSTRLGLAAASAGERLERLLARLDLPTQLDAPLAPPRLLELMRLDKKNHSGRLRFILWHDIGQAHVVDGIEDADVLAVLEQA